MPPTGGARPAGRSQKLPSTGRPHGPRVVGTGVQLLALLDEVERSDTAPAAPGKASRVLSEMGIDLAQLRADLLGEMNESTDGEEDSAMAPVLDELGSTHQRMWEMFVGLESLLERGFGAIEAELQTLNQKVAALEPVSRDHLPLFAV